MKKSVLGVMVAAGLFAAQAQAQFEVRNLSAVPNGSGLDITFSHAAGEFVTISYEVSATPLGSGRTPLEYSWDDLAPGATIRGWNFRGLTPGTDYEVTINSFPRVNSEGGGVVAGTGGSVSVIARTLGQRPFAPAEPDPTCEFADGTLTVTWPAVRYATIYESSLRSEPRGGTPIANLGRRAATTRTYSDSEDLQSGTTYFVDVRAQNSAGFSSWGECTFTTADTETPTDPTTPTQQVCKYEHRLNAVPGATQSYTGWIRVTSRVADGSVSIRAYQLGDGNSLDVLDEEGAVVGSTTGVGPANSTQRFRVQEVTGWHSVVVAHGITTADDMNGVMVSMMLRGPEGLQIVPAHVVEHCAPIPTTTPEE